MNHILDKLSYINCLAGSGPISNMTGVLAQKVALVTGGSDGIGFATAKRFVDEGAALVFITGRRAEKVQQAAVELGKNVVPVCADASNAADVEKLYKIVHEKAGKLDVVFANAGIGGFAPVDSVTEDAIDSFYNTNVKGVILTVQKALPLLVEESSIVITASIVGNPPVGPGLSIYGSTKAAVLHLARDWAIELKDRRIRVNSVSPGVTATSMTKDAGDEVALFMPHISLGRMGRPEEIASAVTFLVSEEASYVNGADLRVDGGWI